MEDNNNKILDEHEKTEEYKFNFINMPWDDRTKSSKVGIVALLVTIALATIACIINNLITQFKSYNNSIAFATDSKCHIIRLEATPFVARIYLVSTQELLCLGAVIGYSSVIANGVCAKSGPIRIGVGSTTKPQCKKGFTVDIIDIINHEGAFSNSIALLTTMDMLSACSRPIRISGAIDYNKQVFILGRTMIANRGLKTLTRQTAIILGPQEFKNMTISLSVSMKKSSLICAKDLANCPVRAGDLLIQDDEIVGLASTSLYRTEQSNIACFADLNIIRKQLVDMMTETIYD